MTKSHWKSFTFPGFTLGISIYRSPSSIRRTYHVHVGQSSPRTCITITQKEATEILSNNPIVDMFVIDTNNNCKRIA